MNLTRQKILEGNYIYPKDIIQLQPTTHFMSRLSERCLGLDCVPTMVRVSEDNIHSAKTKDGKHLHSVVVRLKYTDRKYMFLVINPFDGALKSLWFSDIIKRRKPEERKSI